MTQDLTVGKPISRIWQFAVPVLFGLLLQQVYSLVDTAIVGHALGVMALGGVGATGSVNFLVLGFCGGLCTGMAIPLAQAFGAGEYRQLRRYVAGCVWLGLIMSAVLLAVTLPGTRGLLRLMGTPEEQMDYAFNYIFIIFVGIPTTILYNMGACVLRALGDSKSPVWFLAAASAINIVLDLLTVCVLGLGVAGAALATVVSQLGSGLLCVGYLKKHFPILRMEKDDWKLRRPEVMRLLGMGVPVGLQFSITAIGSVMLQSAVNSLGAVCVSGVAVAGKIYMLLACPFDALAMAATNFTGQNLGAGKPERIKPVYRDCILTVLLIGVPMCALLYFFGQPLLGIYIAKDDPAYASVIASGMVRVTYMGMTYFVCGIMETCCGMVRGLGRSWMPMVVTIFGACVLRIIWIYTIFQTHHTLDVLYLSYPVSWVVTSAVHVLCFVLIYRRMMARWNAHKEEENASY